MTKAKVKKCPECKSDLVLFTGLHTMSNDIQRKTVCGLCAAELEIKGWKEVARVKIVGRDKA